MFSGKSVKQRRRILRKETKNLIAINNICSQLDDEHQISSNYSSAIINKTENHEDAYVKSINCVNMHLDSNNGTGFV